MSKFTEEQTRLNNDLLEASENGDIDAIKRLVTNGANVDRGDEYNITPLMYAARGGHTEAVKLLVSYDANVNAKNDLESLTPLMYAASGGHTKIVDFLLDNGAELEATTSRHQSTALMSAASRGHTETVKLLLDRGANLHWETIYGETALSEAISYGEVLPGDVDTLQLLIDRGADIDAPIYTEDTTLLEEAISRQRLDFVKVLINNGAYWADDVFSWLTHNKMPALKTMREGYNEYLAKFSAFINNQDNHSYIIADSNTLTLNDEKKNVLGDYKRFNQKGLFEIATDKGHTKTIKFLLDHNDKLDKNTALRISTQEGNTETIQLLLDRGADINAVDKDGNTALKIATKKDDVETVRFLLDRGADINAVDKDGNTALKIATEKNNAEIVRFLLDRGADINAVDKDGNTALKIANKKGYTETAAVLIAHKNRIVEIADFIDTRIQKDDRGYITGIDLNSTKLNEEQKSLLEDYKRFNKKNIKDALVNKARATAERAALTFEEILSAPTQKAQKPDTAISTTIAEEDRKPAAVSVTATPLTLTDTARAIGAEIHRSPTAAPLSEKEVMRQARLAQFNTKKSPTTGR